MVKRVSTDPIQLLPRLLEAAGRILAWTRVVSPRTSQGIRLIAAFFLDLYRQDPIVSYSKLLEACVAVRPYSLTRPQIDARELLAVTGRK